MLITLDKDFVYVLAAVMTINVHCMFVGFVLGGGGRSKAFQHDDFMEKYFGKEHEAAFGKAHAVSKQGYPDAGCGRYSKKLTYRQWFDYNLGQRAHANLLETVVPVSIFSLIAGLTYPLIAAGLGAAYIVCRQVYIYGYSRSAEGRKFGIYLTLGVTLGLAVLAFTSVWQLLQHDTAKPFKQQVLY